jgi:predicted NBD/HSP70 family sugar kinase
MPTWLRFPIPRILPPLEPAFRPAVLATRAFAQDAQEAGAAPLVFGLERPDGSVSRFDTVAFPEGHPRFEENLAYADQLLKFLLWQRGGHRVHVGGAERIGKYLRGAYSAEGEHAFDFQFMGRDVFDRPFVVLTCAPEAVPAARESGKPLGRHLEGCRIGFDLGGSDRKVSAVIDGQAVFSEEVVWEPRQHADPGYHFDEVMASLRKAASHLPRVDAIGGSAAGIYVDNQARIASLFRGVPRERYDEVRSLFLRIREAFGVPLEVANDGDVTALAGSMSLGENGILGLAMGTSQAAGYVDMDGHLLGWLNELAFAPIDLNPGAPADEWSGARGAGVQYFSQQCVFRLAPAAGIALPEGVTDARKLEFVQEKLAAGHPGAVDIWRTIGTCLGYAAAQYAGFYELNHILVLGRCTSGTGGDLILREAREVLRQEFPDLARVQLQLPDERSRRVGQSIAAASLPALAG